tara:strand:+ start:462 stop:674 length:213 start_codon:yes stop_codon:yes gene_type:complete
MKINIVNRKVFVDEDGKEIPWELYKKLELFIVCIKDANLFGANTEISDQTCLRIIEFIQDKPWEKDPYIL